MAKTTNNSRVTMKFEDLRRRSEKGLIAYITAGYPDLNITIDLAVAMAEAGVDILELGIPFSDPVADGSIIQEAARQALEGGTTVAGILQAVKKIRQRSSIPLVLMTYYNLVYQYGIARFAADLLNAGGDGLIVADLPMEEANSLRVLTERIGLDLIPLVAPNAPDSRLKSIGQQGSGFIYCISITGITGEREGINPGLKEFTSRVREATKLPIAVGFGISTPEQAKEIAQNCDGVIVGSALVKLISQLKESPDLIPTVTEQIKEWKTRLTS